MKMAKKFYWMNCFNMVEYDGPFDTANKARNDAVQTFNEIQDGVALSIAVIETNSNEKPRYFESASERGNRFDDLLSSGRIVYDGYIEGRKWGDGISPRVQRDE